MGFQLLYRVDLVPRQQPDFLGKSLSFQELLPESGQNPPGQAACVPGENAQQVTIMIVQRPETRGFSGGLHLAVKFRFSGLGAVFPLRAALLQQPATDTRRGVVLPQVSAQAEKPLLALGPHGDVCPHLHLISHLLEGMKKLPFRHGLAKSSVYVPFDEGAPGGFTLLFRLVLGIVLGFSRLGILQDRQTILPAQGVGYFPHGPVIPAAAVKLLAVHKGHGVE